MTTTPPTTLSEGVVRMLLFLDWTLNAELCVS